MKNKKKIAKIIIPVIAGISLLGESLHIWY